METGADYLKGSQFCGTLYAWYQPDKREAMNVNDRSPRMCATFPQEAMTRKKRHVRALPAMRHAVPRQHHPKVGHGYRYKNSNTPHCAFLNKPGQEGTYLLDTSVIALYNSV